MDSNSEIINNNIIITFNNDYSHVYLIKKYIGYGSVIKGIKPKLLIKSNGIPRVLNLINNKIYNKNLYLQIINYIKSNGIPFDFNISPNIISKYLRGDNLNNY